MHCMWRSRPLSSFLFHCYHQAASLLYDEPAFLVLFTHSFICITGPNNVCSFLVALVPVVRGQLLWLPSFKIHWDLVYGQQRLLRRICPDKSSHPAGTERVVLFCHRFWLMIIYPVSWLCLYSWDYGECVHVYTCVPWLWVCMCICVFTVILAQCALCHSPRLFFFLPLWWLWSVHLLRPFLSSVLSPLPPCSICSLWSGSFSVWLLQACIFLTWGPGWQHTWGVPGLPALCTFHLPSPRLGTIGGHMSPPGLSGTLPQALWGWWLSGFGSGKDLELFPFTQPHHIE